MKALLCFLLCLPASIGMALGDEPSWTLLTDDNAAILIHQCSRESPDAIQSVWKPAAAVITGMESRLADIMELKSTACCGAGSRVDDVNAYYRQYAALVIEGRKLIYINAFARKAATADWRQKPLMMCDGGRAFWGVVYDPASGTFSDLAFNGEN